jgi:hypothetical protein
MRSNQRVKLTTPVPRFPRVSGGDRSAHSGGAVRGGTLCAASVEGGKRVREK